MGTKPNAAPWLPETARFGKNQPRKYTGGMEYM